MSRTESYHSTMKLVPKRIFGRVVWFCIPKGHYIRVVPNNKDDKPDKDEYVYLNDPGTIVKGCPTWMGRVRFSGSFGPVCFFRITRKSFGFKRKELWILPSVFTKVALVSGSLHTNPSIKSLFRKPWLKKQPWKLPKVEEKNFLIDQLIGSISKANLIGEVASYTLPNYAIVVIAHTNHQCNDHGVFVVI